MAPEGSVSPWRTGAEALGAHVTVMDLARERLVDVGRLLPNATRTFIDVMREASVIEAFAELGAIGHVYVSAGTTRLGSVLDAAVTTQLDPLVLRL